MRSKVGHSTVHHILQYDMAGYLHTGPDSFIYSMTRIRESAFINRLEMQQTINSQAPAYQIFRFKKFLLEEIQIEHMKHINILRFF